jgi:hypothetical protein
LNDWQHQQKPIQCCCSSRSTSKKIVLLLLLPLSCHHKPSSGTTAPGMPPQGQPSVSSATKGAQEAPLGLAPCVHFTPQGPPVSRWVTIPAANSLFPSFLHIRAYYESAINDLFIDQSEDAILLLDRQNVLAASTPCQPASRCFLLSTSSVMHTQNISLYWYFK